MATVSIKFENDFGDSRKWAIWDTGIDPNAPRLLFDDYLDGGASAGPFALHQDDGGVQGHARYQRSDGPATNIDVSDGDVVSMQ